MSTSLPNSPGIESLRQRGLAAIHAHWKLFLFEGIVMILLGMLAVALPRVATLEIELLVGWLLVVGGLFRVATTLGKRQLPIFGWSLFRALLAIAAGVLLIARPLQGVISLTILMSAFFVIEGTAAIFIAVDLRRHMRHWGWTALSGVANVVLAYLIWGGWPNTANWVIGLLVGINMIVLGMSLVMTSIGARAVAVTGP